jgi:hypothetical protein
MRIGAGLQITSKCKKTKKMAISHFRARYETYTSHKTNNWPHI